MIDIFVRYEETIDDSYHSGERFGDWHEHKSSRVTGVSLRSTTRWQEEKFGLPEVKAGDVVHVLYMIYSSGDSFGTSTGNLEIIWTFKDVALAVEAQKKFEVANQSASNEYSLMIKTDTGESLMVSNPAAGYFENMGDCGIATFIVEA